MKSILTEKHKSIIYQLYLEGDNQTMLAKVFGVSQLTISNVIQAMGSIKKEGM